MKGRVKHQFNNTRKPKAFHLVIVGVIAGAFLISPVASTFAQADLPYHQYEIERSKDYEKFYKENGYLIAPLRGHMVNWQRQDELLNRLDVYEAERQSVQTAAGRKDVLKNHLINMTYRELRRPIQEFVSSFKIQFSIDLDSEDKKTTVKAKTVSTKEVIEQNAAARNKEQTGKESTLTELELQKLEAQKKREAKKKRALAAKRKPRKKVDKLRFNVRPVLIGQQEIGYILTARSRNFQTTINYNKISLATISVHRTFRESQTNVNVRYAMGNRRVIAHVRKNVMRINGGVLFTNVTSDLTQPLLTDYHLGLGYSLSY